MNLRRRLAVWQRTTAGSGPARLLRVRFAAVASTSNAQAWALYDDAGRRIEAGFGAPADWPEADAAEAIVAAEGVRIAAVTLPPLAASKVRSAAAFAVEDQLAGAPGTQHLAASAQRADGGVRVVIVEREHLAAIAALPSVLPRLPAWRRIVAEPDLVPYDGDWHWCAVPGPGGDAFVRLDDGTAMAVPAPRAGALAVEFARLVERHVPAPGAIAVHAAVDASTLAAWSAATGIRFHARPAWQWTECGASVLDAATDLRQGDFAAAAAPLPGRGQRLWRTAFAIAAVALCLHVAAAVAEWVRLRVDAAQTASAWRAVAATAGVEVPPESDARTAVVRRFTELRHASGLAVADDPLPTLARAAPVLARLPRGALKSASFAGGAWTVDLGNLDGDALREFDAGMKAAGVPALIARTGGNVRARFGASS